MNTIVFFSTAPTTTAQVEAKSNSIALLWEKHPLYFIVGAIPILFLMLFLLRFIVGKIKKTNGESFGVKKFSVAGVTAERKKLPVEQVTFVEQPTVDYSYPILFHDICIRVCGSDGNGLPQREVVLSCQDLSQREIFIGNLKATTDQTGTAKFVGITTDKAGTYIVIASCEGKQCASKKVVLPDMNSVPNELVFLTQPQATSGRPADISMITIRAINDKLEGLPGRTIKIQCYDARYSEDILQGTPEAKTDNNGLVEFTDLRISKTGKFRLLATCQGVTCESTVFEVSPPSFDDNYDNKEFGSHDYWDALTLRLYEKKTNDVIRVNGEEL